MATWANNAKRLPVPPAAKMKMAKWRWSGRKFFDGVRSYVKAATNHFWS